MAYTLETVNASAAAEDRSNGLYRRGNAGNGGQGVDVPTAQSHVNPVQTGSAAVAPSALADVNVNVAAAEITDKSHSLTNGQAGSRDTATALERPIALACNSETEVSWNAPPSQLTVGADSAGSTIKQNGGTNVGVSSLADITATSHKNGVKFTPSTSYTTAVMGLSNGDSNKHINDVDFGIKFEWRRWNYYSYGNGFRAVSYTHLTLPTICSV